MADTPDKEIKRIERSHWMLRDCIAEAKHLCHEAQRLIHKHREKAER